MNKAALMTRYYRAGIVLRRLFPILIFLISTSVSAQRSSETVKHTLNGLEITLDAQTGSILRMSYPATGDIISAHPDSAGLVDVAVPVSEFEPLRAASRYSKGVKITEENGVVKIHWDELGASRQINTFKGKVSATVTLKADPDGRSVSMSCTVTNNSNQSIPQVIFPDFFGIVPFGGLHDTRLTTATTSFRPFIDMRIRPHDNFYGLFENMKWLKYGDVFDRNNLVTKWNDIGSLRGGLSVFQKTWGGNRGKNEGVLLQLSEISKKLRYMHTIYTEVGTGSTWTSDEFIVTPHSNGWARGIEPYREWAHKHIKKRYPLPEQVRDGLGFQTLWMKNSFYEGDPGGVNFRFADLPKAAQDAKVHGLNEMVLWVWYRAMELPMPPPFPQLGTEQDMINAVLESRKLGVNIAPFINPYSTRNATAYKYGVRPANSSYIYDPEFIPTFLPKYATGFRGPLIPQSNPLWQQELLGSMKRYIDLGLHSFCWDQFFPNTPGPENYMDTVMTKIMRMARDRYPQASLGGEGGTNIEFEANFLDYTWNWNMDSCDYRPLINVFNQTRINTNIDQSVSDVKFGFADNLYLNLQPRKPDGINGSAYISDYPALSAALKQCARLRKQFLNYFVNGLFISDCILSKSVPDAHISAYVLPKSMLVIVINKEGRKPISFEGDIASWLPSVSGKYKLNVYNDGQLIKKTSVGRKWKEKTPVMNNLDICLYELTAE